MVYTGSSPHGQGEETTFAQIVAYEFGIPIEQVLIMHGDTDSTPEGRGTYGSRTTAVGGAAVFNAVQKLKDQDEADRLAHAGSQPQMSRWTMDSSRWQVLRASRSLSTRSP